MLRSALAAETIGRVPVAFRKVRLPISVVMVAAAVTRITVQGAVAIVVTCVVSVVALAAPTASTPARAHEAMPVERARMEAAAMAATAMAAASARLCVGRHQHHADQAGSGSKDDCGAGHAGSIYAENTPAWRRDRAYCLPIPAGRQCATGRDG